MGKPETSDRIPVVNFAAFLTKPIKQLHLYNVLIHILGQQRINVKPSRPTPPPIDAQLGQKHPLRILLAEDNLINQKVALSLLERMGYKADVALNGLQVLEALRRQPYDVVLMDMQMPEMDGLTATRCICQEWSQTERPRIIAMTANALQGDREQCLKVGMDDYISKPIRVDALVQALSKCQGKKGSRDRNFSVQPFGHENSEASRSPEGVGSGVMEAEAQSSRDAGLLPSSPAPLDIKILQSLRNMIGTKADVVLAEMMDCYLEETPQLLNAIASAIAQEDVIICRRAAHTLKSSSITLGATTLSHLCQELEMITQRGNTVQGRDKLPQLQAEYERVKAALQIERQQLHL